MPSPPLINAARVLLEDDPEIIEDARRHALPGHSLAGAILMLSYGASRYDAEDAVRIALERLGIEVEGA